MESALRSALCVLRADRHERVGNESGRREADEMLPRHPRCVAEPANQPAAQQQAEEKLMPTEKSDRGAATPQREVKTRRQCFRCRLYSEPRGALRVAARSGCRQPAAPIFRCVRQSVKRRQSATRRRSALSGARVPPSLVPRG